MDKDGTMCDVKWDDRGRLYHYHTVGLQALSMRTLDPSKLEQVSHTRACTGFRTVHSPRASCQAMRACVQGCFGLYHLALLRAPEPRCAYLAAARLRPARPISKATASTAGARQPHLRRRVCGGPLPLLLMR